MAELSKHFIKTRLNDGPDIGERPRLHFSAGSGLTFVITDDEIDDEFDLSFHRTDILSGLDPIRVRVNHGSQIGPQPIVNLISGIGTSIIATEDPAENEFEIIIADTMQRPIREETSGTVLTATDYTVEMNVPSASNVFLPDATLTNVRGRIYIIIKTSATGGGRQVIVKPFGSQTINGATTVILNSQWDFIVIQSNNTNWIIIGTS